MNQFYNNFRDTAYLLTFMSAGAIVSMVLTYAIAPFFFDIHFSELFESTKIDVLHSDISFLKLMQFTQSIGLFIAPIYVFYLWKKEEPMQALDLDRGFPVKIVPVIIALVLFSNPFIGWISFWNNQIVFPDFLRGIETWMQQKEAMAADTTKLFLEANNLSDFLLNLLIVAVIPAIGEEFLFRGVLQKKFIKNLKNHHTAIFVSAAIFSAIHLQFYGFFPRLVLGIGLGYLYYWSRSLWLSIAAHFVNNGMAVAFVYFTSDLSLVLPEAKSELDITWYSALASIVVCCGLMMLARKWTNFRKTEVV